MNRTGTPVTGLAALRPYLSLLRGQGGRLALVTALMIVSTAISLAIPLQAGRFVDGFAAAADGASPIDGRALGLLGGLLVLQLAGSFTFSVASAQLGLRTVTRLRRRLYDHLLELPSLYFVDQKAGDLSTRVTGDVGSIQYLLTSGLVSLARALLTLAGALVLMFRLNPRLAGVVLLLVPVTILLVRLFGRRLQTLSRRMYDELGRISSHVQESVAGIRTLKVYNGQTAETRRFGGMIDDYLAAGIRRAWVSSALESLIQITLWICLIGVMVYGFGLAARGEATGGQLVAFLLLAFRVAMPLASLTNLFSSAQGAAAAAGRLDDIFSLPPERTPGAAVPAPVHTPAGIRCEGVGFRYPGAADRDVLGDLDVDIAPGQWVGIVGPSGAGKSTLAGLVMGLFPPTRGRLVLDSRPYADYDLGELRSRMAFVAQEPVLYDMSLAENIRFGLADADDAAVREAARRAGVLEFADALPDGLDARCGERGGRLSGGQKQRVALARAFLRNPGLLVLDEPTSALDAASEQAIQTALSELMNGRTTLVIAHRFSLVRDLDLILVVDQGRIVERGRHNELMAQGGLYRRLYDYQQGTDNEDHNLNHPR
ncbi:ABC transporter ATP-binding protein [bacterium]|nr:ABC transporter ATP-binding protein [bacterium]